MAFQVTMRDMQPEDEEFVGSCTHVQETDEWTASCRRRVPWLRAEQRRGLRVKVLLCDSKHAGFVYLMPIEVAPWGPVGRDLMVLQCLVVKSEVQGRGLGRALVASAEEETRRQRCKALVVPAFYHDFWFMPAPFFERCGFAPVARQGSAALLWKPFDSSAEPPVFMQPRYRFRPIANKVAVDLFWSHACLTSDTEAQRVREVVAEFGDAVELHEFCSDAAAVRSQYGICRAIFVDGTEVGWGYEAPKEGLRDAFRQAMAGSGAR